MVHPTSTRISFGTMDHEHTPPAPEGLSQHVENPSHSDSAPPSSGDSGGSAGGRDARPQTSSIDQQQLRHSPSSQRALSNLNADSEHVLLPAPAPTRDSHRRRMHFYVRRRAPGSTPGEPDTDSSTRSMGKNDDGPLIGERIENTIKDAQKERDKYARRVVLRGYTLNIFVGLQVLLGALTTALAAALTSAKQAQIATALLGGLATVVASYLARERGAGEPELSTARVKDLEHFLRECKAFKLDHGHESCNPHEHHNLNLRLDTLRRRFEEILGNVNSEKKHPPAGGVPNSSSSKNDTAPSSVSS